LEFSVFYWINYNFPFLCYVLLLRFVDYRILQTILTPIMICNFYLASEGISFLTFGSLVKNCNHKGLGIYYLLSAFIFGIVGTLISVLIRIELYSSGNRIISPENQNFYNISITLHGFLMIFFLVMPGLFGGFGNYFVPIFQGSPEVVYPRVNNFSILILSLSYLFVILSFISEFGGGTGWTLYPPLSTSFT
jgi:heme/copper-type cytochrome/quinol oxidase subunit 1